LVLYGTVFCPLGVPKMNFIQVVLNLQRIINYWCNYLMHTKLMNINVQNKKDFI
jgi:hypothetical protein